MGQPSLMSSDPWRRRDRHFEYPLFYAVGLMYGQRSNLVTAEYWRWWVAHLCAEGFFEVFATSSLLSAYAPAIAIGLDRDSRSLVLDLRALGPGKAWKNAPLAFAFWAINIGLALMVLLSMLPIGLMQAWASVEYGTWYARSAEFLHSGHINQLCWMRMIGDSIFGLGAVVLGWFVLGLVTGQSYDKQGYVLEGGWEVLSQEVTPLQR